MIPAGVEQFLSVCKQAGAVVAAGTLVWGVFSFLHAVTKTLKAIPIFMQTTTQGVKNIERYMVKAVDNHLSHIESGITELAQNTSGFEGHMETLQKDFRQYVVDDARDKAVILERLPQL